MFSTDVLKKSLLSLTVNLVNELHWLPVCYRIEYKIILLTFKALHGMAPDYLCHLISVLPPSRYNRELKHRTFLGRRRRLQTSQPG